MKTKILLAALVVASTTLSCENESVNDIPIENSNRLSVSKDLPTNNVLLTLNGTADFVQEPWANNYIVGGESTPIPGDHTLSTPNPILSEQNKYSDYASNVPLDLQVTNAGGSDWYQQYKFTFTNRSNKTLHLDSGIIMFVAPKNSNADREFGASSHHGNGHGHPQQDYVEVPIAGTPNSWYIARLVFHDVSEESRSVDHGDTWFYRIGVPTNPMSNPGWITTEQSRKTVRFMADLTGNKNQDVVVKYGTKRFRN